MVTIKTVEEIENLREGGRRLASVINEVVKNVKPGVLSIELDKIAFDLISVKGDKPSFLGYKSKHDKQGYPATICISINDEIVHSPPKTGKILKEGDIVSIDIGLIHKGLFTDSAVTVPVGKIDKSASKLLEVTKKSLSIGIEEARVGNTTGDIGFAIEKYVKKYGYGIVRELAGHGVGYEVHEDPYIPNYGSKGGGVPLKAGMVIAIEPMLNEGTAGIVLDKEDGMTYRTADGKRSAHFEHTLVVTDDGPEILTVV